VLQRFTPCQAALPFLFGHLVKAMELLRQALLLLRRQTVEARTVAQQPFLVLRGQIAMLVQPVAEMAGRGGRPLRRSGIGPCCRSSAIPALVSTGVSTLRLPRLALKLPALAPILTLTLALTLTLTLILILTAELPLILPLRLNVLPLLLARQGALPCTGSGVLRSGATLSGTGMLRRHNRRRQAQETRRQQCRQAHSFRVGRPLHLSFRSWASSRSWPKAPM
jgi:hypothetical protein